MYKHLHGKKIQDTRELFQLAGKCVGRTNVCKLKWKVEIKLLFQSACWNSAGFHDEFCLSWWSSDSHKVFLNSIIYLCRRC